MDASYQIIPTGSSFTLTCPVETKIDWLKPKRYTEEDVFYILKKVFFFIILTKFINYLLIVLSSGETCESAIDY